MINSILDSVKKTLGLSKEYDVFDHDIVTHINSALSTLTQLGVGPAEGFAIEGADEEWSAFLGSANPGMNPAKSYVYLKTRMLFDPPTTSYMISAMERQISELEWRLNIQAETPRLPPQPVL